MKKRKIIGISLAVLIILGFFIRNMAIKPVLIQAPSSLGDYLIPINTTKANSGFSDLHELGDLLKDKKIIAMGEATHGTKEFFQMKHRMFEYLVLELGYRVFAMEADFGGAQLINDYIVHGYGNIDKAITALGTYVWMTEEIADMIEWMKEFNDNPENTTKIKFYGFDMKSVDVDVRRVKAYLAKVERDANYSLYNHEEYNELFEKNRESYIEQTSLEEFLLIEKHLNIITQQSDFKKAKVSDRFNLRDYYMAQNVKWILDYEKLSGNDKLMLWAHNLHVVKEFYEAKPMGQLLLEMYKDEYYTIGFDFYQGQYRAVPMTRIIQVPIGWKLAEFEIKPNDNLFAFNFHRTGIPIAFMDFNYAAKNTEIKEWLSKTHSLHHITAGSNPDVYWLPLIPINTYDALIFIDKTTATVGKNEGKSAVIKGSYIVVLFQLLIVAFILFIFYRKRLKKKQAIS